MKPNFLIVGAAKSGTSAVAKSLVQHPSVFMSRIKEPSYFCNEPNCHGITTDSDYFRLFNKSSGFKAVGEASVKYLWKSSYAAPSIYGYLGDISIIAILRNPIERAFSDYLMEVRKGGISCSFADVLCDRESDIISIGRYSKQIHEFKKRFSRIQLFLYDDLDETLLSTLICDAIDVPRMRLKLVRDNNSQDWRFPIMRKLNSLIRYNSFFVNYLSDKQTQSLKNRLLQPVRKSIAVKDWQALSNIYNQEISCLEEDLNIDLKHWLDYDAYKARTSK